MSDPDHDDLSPEDTCCACYGCPDHGHDCGLPPLEAAKRRAYFLHQEAKIIELMLAEGQAAACEQCGGLYDPRMVFGGRCYEHGGMLVESD